MSQWFYSLKHRLNVLWLSYVISLFCNLSWINWILLINSFIRKLKIMIWRWRPCKLSQLMKTLSMDLRTYGENEMVSYYYWLHKRLERGSSVLYYQKLRFKWISRNLRFHIKTSKRSISPFTHNDQNMDDWRRDKRSVLRIFHNNGSKCSRLMTMDW